MHRSNLSDWTTVTRCAIYTLIRLRNDKPFVDIWIATTSFFINGQSEYWIPSLWCPFTWLVQHAKLVAVILWFIRMSAKISWLCDFFTATIWCSVKLQKFAPLLLFPCNDSDTIEWLTWWQMQLALLIIIVHRRHPQATNLQPLFGSRTWFRTLYTHFIRNFQNLNEPPARWMCTKR